MILATKAWVTELINKIGTPKDGKDGVDGVDGKDGKDGRNGIDGATGADGQDGQRGADGLNSPGGSHWITNPIRGAEAATFYAQTGKKWEALTLVFRVFQGGYARPVLHLPRAIVEAGAGPFQVTGMSDGTDIFYASIEIVSYSADRIRIKVHEIGFFTGGRFNSRPGNAAYAIKGGALSY